MDSEDATAKQAAASLKRDLRARLAASLGANRQASLAAARSSVQALLETLPSSSSSSSSSSSLGGSSGSGSGSTSTSEGGGGGGGPVVDMTRISAALAGYRCALDAIEAAVSAPESTLGPEGA
jgi:hypothetical protein